MEKRHNILRGFMKLWVWQDAKKYYGLAYKIYGGFPSILFKVVSNQIACIDSIHRNIAEGYCRKSKKEYLRYLDIAIASLGESTSGNHVYLEAGQINEKEFESLDKISFKLENCLKKLISSLRAKKEEDWNDSFLAGESESNYNSSILDTGITDRWTLRNLIVEGDSLPKN